MRPQVCLVYSGDINQYHRLKEILKSNFEGKSNVPLAVLKPVNEHPKLIQKGFQEKVK